MRERRGRTPGAPATRWTDDFCSLAGHGWIDLAMESNVWEFSIDAFARREDVLERIGY